MPVYQTTPFKPSPQALIQGKPEYVFGSFDDKSSPTQGTVISNATNGTTTATLIFQILSGNVPLVGDLITVIGCANSANFNVTNVAVLTVSCTTAGVCTVTYTITSTATPTSQTADTGRVIVPRIEVPEAINGTEASVPVAAVVGATVVGRATSASVTLPANSAAYPSTLSGVTVVIQGSNVDKDDHYKTIGTLTAAGAQGNTYDWQSGQETPAEAGNANPGGVDILSYRFYRLNVTGVRGSGYIIGTIMQ